MQKVLFSIVLSVFLLGCADDPAVQQVNEHNTPEIQVIKKTTFLTDDVFVTLSAKILCLSKQFPKADALELEQKANDILTQEGVTEEDYSNYQVLINQKENRKQQIGLAILGQADNLCSILAD